MNSGNIITATRENIVALHSFPRHDAKTSPTIVWSQKFFCAMSRVVLVATRCAVVGIRCSGRCRAPNNPPQTG